MICENFYCQGASKYGLHEEYDSLQAEYQSYIHKILTRCVALNGCFIDANNNICINTVIFEYSFCIMTGKRILHRVTSLVLAVVMLSASTGFTVDIHYCSDKIQSFSIFGEADSCAGMLTELTCEESNHDSDNRERHCTLEKKKCCEDRMLYVQPLEDLNVSVYSLSTDLSDQSATIIDTRDWSFNILVVKVSTSDFEYRPPLLLRTTPVVLQSFLI
ncbi:MAG: hypothetical protein DRI69_05595 [Bacteroidetes bacterium]|nr:MAG: hypothetical protein DRI69_05595 [Bacteroidota bacterium]